MCYFIANDTKITGNPQKPHICTFSVRQVFRDHDTFYMIVSELFRTGSTIKKTLQFAINACERCGDTNIASINIIVGRKFRYYPNGVCLDNIFYELFISPVIAMLNSQFITLVTQGRR